MKTQKNLFVIPSNEPKTLEEYKKIYLDRCADNISSRNRKTVIMDAELHTSLSILINVLDRRDITISGFVHTIIKEHIKENKDLLMKLYKSRQTPIF